ncbi:hypothetical protein LINPERPRIM_LOCUS28918 [Linum perenne]
MISFNRGASDINFRLPPVPCTLYYFLCVKVISAPVFHNRAFYSMDSRGRLAVFKPQHNNNNNKTWRMLDTEHAAFDDCSEAYLMESSNSELISVVVTASTSSANVLL